MTRIDREITARELLLLVAGACLVAVVVHWPLVLHLGRDIPKDLGDPLAQAWQVAWGGHALLEQPLRFFQSNQFWPLEDTLAFSDALVGYAPAGLIGSGSEAAVARYDVLFLFAYALAFAGAYLLGRELGLGPGAAAVAGAAFAFAPFRLEQDGHLHVISSGGIPLALALLVRGYRRARPAWVLAGGAVATWQLSLGFTLGLPFGYLLAALALLAAVAWLRRGRPPIDRRLAAATAASAIVFIAAAAILSQPYFRVADEYSEARRTPAEVEEFSGPARVFLVAPEENLVWGQATEPLREGLDNVPEKTLFPGLAILALAVAGMRSGVLSPGLRVGIAAAAVLVSLLALGFQEEGGLLYPYRVLYELLPGWEGIRAPGRLVSFSSLALALLAGAGAHSLVGLARRRRAAPTVAATAVPALLALAITVEGTGLPFDPGDDRAQPSVPAPPADLSAIAAPQLHLPAERPEDNRRYLLWSTDGFPPIVNGRSSLEPRFTRRLIERVSGFPDRRSVALLAGLGVRSVVLHPRRTRATPFDDVGRREHRSLPVSRRRRGDVVVYEIRSPGTGSASTTAVDGRLARRVR